MCMHADEAGIKCGAANYALEVAGVDQLRYAIKAWQGPRVVPARVLLHTFQMEYLRHMQR